MATNESEFWNRDNTGIDPQALRFLKLSLSKQNRKLCATWATERQGLRVTLYCNESPWFSFIKDIAQVLSCIVLCNSARRSLSDASPVGDAIPTCLSIYDSCCRFRFLFAHASFQYKRRMYRHVSLSCSRATQYTPQVVEKPFDPVLVSARTYLFSVADCAARPRGQSRCYVPLHGEVPRSGATKSWQRVVPAWVRGLPVVDNRVVPNWVLGLHNTDNGWFPIIRGYPAVDDRVVQDFGRGLLIIDSGRSHIVGSY